MTQVSELDLPAFDYFDPALAGARFHATMAALARDSWIARTPLGYTVLDHESCEFFLRSRSFTFPGMKVAEMFDVSEGPLFEEISKNIININGKDHGRLRQLVNPALSPRAAERYRPAMRRFLSELFDGLDGETEFDFVSAFAKPYPSLTIATVMGAPLSDAPRLHHWSEVIQRQFASNLHEEREEIERAVVEFYDYTAELMAARRANPGDDLISALLAAEEGGDRLSAVECQNLVLNILIGGVDTTQAQLSHAVRLLAEHPDQWALLAERPELVPNAVEESLRHEPITPFTARIAVEDAEFRDIVFPEGTVVLVSSFNGNRDGAVYPDPDRFDITREARGNRVLTFGAGIHYCLGANLARAELQEALAFLPSRLPGLELAGEPRFQSVHGIYGLDELPVRFVAALV